MDRSPEKNDSLDTTFLDCLREIEKSYITLPKPLRLRTEKWCEKLMSTGKNRVWRKSRNDYAKMLLGMIISKHLSEPFHAFPPDGPLSAFPFHLRPKLKQSLGPHESAFWRQLYSAMDDSERPAIRDSRDHLLDKFNGIDNRKEMQSLQSLVREQEKRISLLEQQLHDERIQYELEIQRLVYAHRIELSQITRLNADINESLDSVKQSAIPARVGKKDTTGTSHFSIFSDQSPSRTASSNSRNELSYSKFGSSQRTGEINDEDFLAYLESFQKDIYSISNT